MHATVGDFLVIASRHVGEASRVGLILEVHGDDWAPPYVVKWEDDERTTLVFPGPDAHTMTPSQLHSAGKSGPPAHTA